MNKKLFTVISQLEHYGHTKAAELVKRLESGEQVKIAKLDDVKVSPGLEYHLENNQSILDPIYRINSKAHFDFVREVSELYKAGSIYLDSESTELLTDDLGKFAEYEGQVVPLDMPMRSEDEAEICKMAAEYKGKKVEIGKPKKNSGSGGKWVVYVMNKGKVKKITYGSPDMAANWNDPKARKSFAARHQCDKKRDRTKAGYWACRAHKDFGKNVPGRFW